MVATRRDRPPRQPHRAGHAAGHTSRAPALAELGFLADPRRPGRRPLIRVSWQFPFSLRTDLYALVATVLGCVDLHATARRLLANRVNRLLRRRHRLLDETTWHPTDRRAARWYSWLILIGYSTSLAPFLFALWPATYHLFRGVIHRFAGQAQGSQLLDSTFFLTSNVVQVSIVVAPAIRERRSRASYRHVIA
jgi:hypothetical protein